MTGRELKNSALANEFGQYGLQLLVLVAAQAFDPTVEDFVHLALCQQLGFFVLAGRLGSLLTPTP